MAEVVTLEAGSQLAWLARQLRHMILDGRFPAATPLPSHRSMAEQFGVGVQVVRSALACLEEEGLVQSRPRRGVFVRLEGQVNVPESSAVDRPIRCINLVERLQGTVPGFVRSDYLQGYTEILDCLDVKFRVVSHPPFEQDLSQDKVWRTFFSPHFELAEQGLILLNLLWQPLMHWLNRKHVRYVVQKNRAYDLADYPPHRRVYINKVQAGFQATRHLIELGHRRIGFIGTAPARWASQYDLFCGYHAAITCTGQTINPDDVLDMASNDVQQVVEPVRRFLDRPGGPTAYFTQTDAMALAVMEAARQLGRRVPQDVSVIGFDDLLPSGQGGHPALTTVANPRVALAKAAVEMLLASPGDREVPTRVLDGYLICRASTAAPSS